MDNATIPYAHTSPNTQNIQPYPPKAWVPPRYTRNKTPILDVLIIGGGQSGLGIAAALKREKVERILVIDENPLGQEGPWGTFARMPTLRTPKYVTGPDLGISSLSYQSWHEAQFGKDHFSQLPFIPTESWANYLSWYRRTLQIPVQNNTRAGPIKWLENEQCFEIPCGQDIQFARKVVLSTGIDGCGQWDIPPLISDKISKSKYAHTRDNIEFEKLAGKSIACLGAGASSFDNALFALKHRCLDTHIYFRRDKLPNVNPYRWAEFVGFLNHHSDLHDDDKWRFIKQILKMGQLPPRDTFERAKAYPNFHLHSSSPWLNVREEKNHVIITTPHGEFRHDFIIVGTGFKTDLSKRHELSEIEKHIARWHDRYQPKEHDDDMLQHPYLGAHFEFQEKIPGTQPWISGLFCYTFGGLVSHGFSGGSISGLKYSLPKLVSGITSQLYRDDLEHHYQTLCEFDEKEF